MNEPSAPDKPHISLPSEDKRSNQSLAQSLLQANQELRASVVSNVIKKGLIGLGVGIGLGLFVFKRAFAQCGRLTGLCREGSPDHVHDGYWIGNGVQRGFTDGTRLP